MPEDKNPDPRYKNPQILKIPNPRDKNSQSPRWKFRIPGTKIPGFKKISSIRDIKKFPQYENSGAKKFAFFGMKITGMGKTGMKITGIGIEFPQISRHVPAELFSLDFTSSKNVLI